MARVPRRGGQPALPRWTDGAHRLWTMAHQRGRPCQGEVARDRDLVSTLGRQRRQNRSDPLGLQGALQTGERHACRRRLLRVVLARHTMNPHLFVYGSLISSANRPMGGRLRRESRLVGPATILGRLYRISWYPALVETEDQTERVHGEVYALNSPRITLAWLDAYEGISSGRPDGDDYARLERRVTLGSSGLLDAWVYV